MVWIQAPAMAWATKPPTVTDLLPDTQGGRERFLRVHPDPALLIVGYADDHLSADRTVRLGSETSSGEIPSVASSFVIAVKKHRTLGADKILLGRGRENDVVLPFKSVSRLHAFFRHGTDGLWTVEDAGSAYGTFVRGTRLTSGHVRALGDDTPIQFGGVEAIFHTAEGLFGFLTKVSKARNPDPSGT